MSENRCLDSKLWFSKLVSLFFEHAMDATDIQSLATALNALGPSTSANAVSVQLPSFWSEDPELWFLRVEAQFSLRNVTNDDTKFYNVVSALDNTASVEIKNVLLHPPAQGKYGALKSALLAAFATSQAQKDAELLAISGLWDFWLIYRLYKLYGFYR